jgi:hypothetical protein
MRSSHEEYQELPLLENSLTSLEAEGGGGGCELGRGAGRGSGGGA